MVAEIIAASCFCMIAMGVGDDGFSDSSLSPVDIKTSRRQYKPLSVNSIRATLIEGK
jgi:hypothetical protein